MKVNFAKFAGLGCVATLGPCTKEDVFYFHRKLEWPLVEIDYEGVEPDPELEKLFKQQDMQPFGGSGNP